MSEPNVYEQLAGMTIERDAALSTIARVEAFSRYLLSGGWDPSQDGFDALVRAGEELRAELDGRKP